MDRPDFLLLQRADHIIAFEFIVVQSAYPAIRSDPEIALAIFKNRSRTEIAESVTHLVVGEPSLRPAAHSFVGCNPDASIPTLQKSTNEVVYQSLAGRVVDQLLPGLVIYAATVGSDPEHSFAVAKNVSHSHPGQRRKAIGSSLVFLKPEQISSSDPNIAVQVLINGLGIRIGSIRQCDRSHRSLAQPQHSRLRTHPDIRFNVFKQTQDRVARQAGGSGDLGELVMAVNVKSVADRANPQTAIGRLAQKPNRHIESTYPLESIGPSRFRRVVRLHAL